MPVLIPVCVGWHCCWELQAREAVEMVAAGYRPFTHLRALLRSIASGINQIP